MAVTNSGLDKLYDTEGLALWRAERASWTVSELELDEWMADLVCQLITRTYPRARRVGLLVGGGGNGRQARAIGRRYQRSALEPVVFCPNEDLSLEDLRRCDVLIDGLIGTGLRGSLLSGYKRLADLANASERPLVAVDGPSGLDLGRGSAVPGALRARQSVLCGVAKLGAFTGAGPELCGDVTVARFGAHPSLRSPVPRLPPLSEVAALRPGRPRDTHKGEMGTLGILGGDVGMPGAVRLAASAAYRVGAGLVWSAVHPRNAPALAAGFPELMAFSGASGQPPLSRAQWLLVGSGMGRGGFGERLWEVALAAGHPLLVDGDGLYWLTRHAPRRSDWVLTPHEGEAARLLGVTRGDVASDRLGAARALQARYGGVCVLKGAGTLILGEGAPWVCPWGNPGMATAGMGDVLAGVIGGLAVQGLSAGDAARLGVFVHARAGDRAAAVLGYVASLMPSDLIKALPFSLEQLC